MNALRRARSVPTFLALITLAFAEPCRAQSPATVAEKSSYTATSKHDDVIDFCKQLAKASPLVRLGELGNSHEGRRLPVVIIADPPLATPEEAKKSGKLVVFALGGIHAGEVDGKEALLMLARDLALAKDRSLLKDLVVVIAPNFNADGGDKLGNNRLHQAGPAQVGTRANAQGFDLNRDFVKLETPEVQTLVRFLTRWDPALVIDTHTTNGSTHRYTITFDGPRHPALHAPLARFTNERLLPDVGQRLEKACGYKAFFYGNFAGNPKQWETTLAQPRMGFHYLGFRNRIGILSESYVYAPYRDRVLATQGFVRACLEFAADNQEAIGKLLKEADDAGRSPAPDARVALRHKLVPLPKPVKILGLEGGKTPATGTAKDFEIDYLGRTEATLSVTLPFAYLVPATFPGAVENLKRHGIKLERLSEDIRFDVEVYRIDKIVRQKPFQKHALVSVQATQAKDSRVVQAGTYLVRTRQPLGVLAAFLLEPQSEDGLCTWNFFDSALGEGQDFPVLRLPAEPKKG
ncbi:MAG: M14 family metallopeptidase [Gemmataceae bacterium]|nr:M14 family metallopeptidase [Gemmataceae bacterium]MCI0738127.1 M14 family metallopeptidase [Gemmataceae bacterium]